MKTEPIPDYLSDQLKESLKKAGIKSLFEVQFKTLKDSISGTDLVVQARTGSGKTLAFVLPVVERLSQSKLKIQPNQPRVLCLAPTRELAAQIHTVFQKISDGTKLKSCAVYGGASYDKQRCELKTAGIVAATPGRLKDLINNGDIDLSKIKVVIFDEVDRMLDMGFEADVEEILSYCPYPKKGDEQTSRPQTLFYSATCPDWVMKKSKEIMQDVKFIKLVDDSLAVSGTSKLVEHLSIQIDRFDAVATCVRDLVRLYSAGRQSGRAIVFTNTKKDANELALGDISIGDAQVMHGDIDQKQREVTLKGFREGKFRCLVATDVAARGLDIPQIDLVIQTSPPKGSDIESYVHRSGRTGRAGKPGVCCCIYNFKNKHLLKNIERATGVEFRDIPIPQPIDVAKSVLKEKLHEGVKAVMKDPNKQFELFEDLAEEFTKTCENDPKKAIACLMTYIAQDGEVMNARSMISGSENWQTWLLEFDSHQVNSVLGLSKAILRRNCIPDEAIEQLKQWREYEELSSLGGKGLAFDLPSEFTQEILEVWEEGKVISGIKGKTMLKRCGTALPKLKGFKSRFDNQKSGFRGNGSGYQGNRGQGGRGFSGGKRKFGGSSRGGFKRQRQ